MDEARRFLRFIGPGVLFFVEAAFLFWLLRPDLARQWIGAAATKAEFAAVIAGLLASGGLGYFFSAVHHQLHWQSWGSVIDHESIIKGLVKDGRLKIALIDERGITSEPLAADQIGKFESLAIMTAFWHSNRHRSPIDAADARVTTLSDLAHSLGTARAASLFAVAAAFGVAWANSSCCASGWPIVRFVAAVLIGAAITWLFWRSYWRVGQFAQAVIELVFMESLGGATGYQRVMSVSKRALLPNSVVEPAARSWLTRVALRLRARR